MWVVFLLLVLGVLRTTFAIRNCNHHWRFDGDLVDNLGGADGVQQGNVTFSDESMVGGKALSLGCCDSRVILSDPQLHAPFTYYTISLWFREEVTMDKVRYLYEEGAAWNGIALRLKKQTVQAAVIEGGGGKKQVQVASAGPVKLRTWHHVALVYSDGMLQVFLDSNGSEVIDTGLGELGARRNGASIGGRGLTDFASDLRYVGLVDDMKIWSGVALSEEEIQQLYMRPSRPNIVLFVADDLNYDSPSFTNGGGVAPDVTPNLDKLANNSIVFTLAHAAVSVCQPSRQAMLSGKYPPNYGQVGFFPMAEGTQTVVTKLQQAGYITSNLYKMWHMQPTSSFPWDMTEDSMNLEGREFRSNGSPKKVGRSPSMLAQGTRKVIQEAQNTDQPFFLVVNSADPHRPFHGAEGAQQFVHEQIESPSRVYSPEEVKIPNPLPDIPQIRADVARYASSVRRLDDAIGACLQTLEDEGVNEDTVVLFVSDNGMPLPFGKFETYRDSLNGPLIIRMPRKVEPRLDSTSLVSLTDIAPTLLDIAHADPLVNIDGRSLLPLARGDSDVVWRDVIVGSRYEDIFYGLFIDRYPDPDAKRDELRLQGWVDATEHSAPGTMKRTMNKRSITDGRFQYIYNHFFNENKPIFAFPYESQNYFAMVDAGESNATLAERVEFYKFRAQEEFYDYLVDPGFENNLIDHPDVQQDIEYFKGKLLSWMEETNDPTLADYSVFLSTF